MGTKNGGIFTISSSKLLKNFVCKQLTYRTGKSMTSAANLYSSVINDVIQSVRDSFLDEGIDEGVLQELKSLWEAKLAASKTIDHSQRGQEAMLDARQRMAAAGGSQAGGSAVGGSAAGGAQQSGDVLVFNDKNRLVPVQITIPAQPGNVNSQARALTVQVPAHALQKESPTSGVLQTVLTQAIPSALDLPESHAAKFLQDQINAAFRGAKPM